MASDPVAAILQKSAPPSVRAAAWDAFHSAKDEDDLAERLKALDMPREAKAQLWDLKTGSRPVGPAHPEATLSAGEPEGFMSRALGAVREAVMGSPERQEATQAGIYQQPTPADLAKTAAAGAAAMGGGYLMGSVAANPMAAAKGLGLGAAGGWAGEKAGGEAGEVAERIGAPAGTKKVLQTVGAVGGALAGPGAGPKALARVAAAAPESSAAAVARAVLGTEAATSNAALNKFARAVLGSKAKTGHKVHLLLEAPGGRPLAVLTPGEAGAATRMGKPTTWIRLGESLD